MLTVTLGWPVWLAILATFVLCIAIGALNGLIVVRTGLPSFIVTLAFLFILRGFTIFLPQLIERKSIIGGVSDLAQGDPLAWLFGGKILTGFFAWLGENGLIATVDKVRKKGIAVVFITHNVRHALAVGDRFTVLNRGKTLGTAQRGQITPEELQDMMAGGQELAALEGRLAERSDSASGAVALASRSRFFLRFSECARPIWRAATNL